MDKLQILFPTLSTDNDAGNIVNFGDGEYAIKILNNGVVVHNQEEWLDVVYDFL